MSPYVSVAILFVLCAVVVGAMVSLNRLLGPIAGGEVKSETFECGNPSSGSAWGRFSVKFYMPAILFIVFDLEVVFLYPWAVTFGSLGGPVGEELSPLFLGRVCFFILTSIIAFVYAWRKGVFRYD